MNNIGIGDGSVIAACACVRRDVPADTMVAGVPARVIKELEDLGIEDGDTVKMYGQHFDYYHE